MAFLETSRNRVLKEGVCPVKVTLEEAVQMGDPLGISATPGWVLSASATVEQPVLIAGEKGAVGQTIVAYLVAIVECKNLLANKATLGEKVAVTDTGLYAAAGVGLPDVGFVASVDADSLGCVLFLNPTAPQLTVVRS